MTGLRTTRRDLVIRRDGLSQLAVVGLLVALAAERMALIQIAESPEQTS